jgi:hypothetical protein
MFIAIACQHEAMSRPVTAAALVRVKATLRTELNAAIRAGHITPSAASRAELTTPGGPKPWCRILKPPGHRDAGTRPVKIG